jgi:hypothetical protein
MIIEVNEITALFDEFYLIEEKPLQAVKESEIPLKINFEGGNGKGLVFVFGHVLTQEDQDMIQKLIHNALKIKMEDIALVDLSSQNGIQMQQVIEIIKPKQLVLWGNHGIFPTNSLYEVSNIGQVRFIKVDEVNRFHQDVALKTSLWNGIQQLLNG